MTTGCGMHKLASISAAWTATAQSTALVASSMMKMYDQPATVNEPCSHIGQNYLQFSKIQFIGCHFYEYEPICCQIYTLRPVLRSALGQKWHFCFTSTQPIQHQHILFIVIDCHYTQPLDSNFCYSVFHSLLYRFCEKYHKLDDFIQSLMKIYCVSLNLHASGVLLCACRFGPLKTYVCVYVDLGKHSTT